MHFQLVLLLTEHKSLFRDFYIASLLSFSSIRFVVFSVLNTDFLPFLLDFLIIGTSLCPHCDCTAWGMELAPWEKRLNAAVLVQKDYIPQSTASPWTGLGLPDNCLTIPHWFSAPYRSCVSRERVKKCLTGLELLHGTRDRGATGMAACRCCVLLHTLTSRTDFCSPGEMGVGVSWLQGLLHWLLVQRFNTLGHCSLKTRDVPFFSRVIFSKVIFSSEV